ncbi:hypothetical protein L6259_04255 [Candidatus Parcubacteria bacterium]|nr:hypothetical protein [Candidatus Parcubacteria bacterium]
MFNTTLDILYCALACSVGLLTVVLIIFFIYLIGALSKINKIMKEAMGISKIIAGIKDKMEHGMGHLGLIADMIGKIVMHFIEGKIEVKRKKK